MEGLLLLPDYRAGNARPVSASGIRTRFGANPAAMALITVDGDSISPTIDDGDIVLVDTSARGVRYDAVYVVLLEGAPVIRRLCFGIDGSVTAVADNLKYPSYVMTKNRIFSRGAPRPRGLER